MAEVEEAKADLAGSFADHASDGAEQAMPSPEQEEAAIKKKYGGLLPKKPPLISKDHERAYFDSADWALGKVGHGLRLRRRVGNQARNQKVWSKCCAQSCSPLPIIHSLRGVPHMKLPKMKMGLLLLSSQQKKLWGIIKWLFRLQMCRYLNKNLVLPSLGL